MILIDNIMYIEFQELVECGVSDNYMRKLKSEQQKDKSKHLSWRFIDAPNDKRKVLVEYEPLKEDYKQKIKDRIGDPYEMLARQPILDMVIQDPAAYEYYNTYKYGEGKYLPAIRVKQYTRAASWLNMLQTVQDDRSIIKKVLKLNSIPDFYINAGTLIKKEIENSESDTYIGIHCLPNNFPSTYQRLMEKVKGFKSQGFDYIINPMYGNKIAAKLGKTETGYDADREREQMAIIRAIAAKHVNLDAGQVTKLANIVFTEKGWETIKRSRVYQIMQDNKALLVPGRRGLRQYRSDVEMQVKRITPKHPTYFWTLDGWTVELLYKDKSGFDNRLVMVVVLDACNKYPVGYAIGERENTELIKQANRNALLHMHELFGDFYYPNQLQSDHYALKSLTPFYQAVSHLFTPAAVGNAKSKIVEPYFQYLNKNYCQLQPNWGSFNITAKKTNQVNAEFLNMIKHSFPDKKGVIMQIEAMMSAERMKKREAYIQAWEAMPHEHRKVMDKMDWLMVFGLPIGETNKITGQGIIKTIDNIDYTYNSFDPAFRQKITKDWQIIADTQDLSEVLAVSPDGTLRYLLHKIVEIPMDILSTTDEHRAYHSEIKQYNKDRKEEVVRIYAEDNEIARRVMREMPLQINTHEEAALKLMFTTGTGQQKERIQDAKRLKRAQDMIEKQDVKEQKTEAANWQAVQTSYLTGKVDFNEFKD